MDSTTDDLVFTALAPPVRRRMLDALRERHLSRVPVPIKRVHDRWISGSMASAVRLLADLGAE